jgi:hypothetical protein
MAEQTWTDDRIDEKMTAIDRTFDMLHNDLSGLREEIVGMRSDLARFQDRMIQIGFGLVFALLAALVTTILALA